MVLEFGEREYEEGLLSCHWIWRVLWVCLFPFFFLFLQSLGDSEQRFFTESPIIQQSSLLNIFKKIRVPLKFGFPSPFPLCFF